jgi:hypothetical protein
MRTRVLILSMLLIAGCGDRALVASHTSKGAAQLRVSTDERTLRVKHDTVRNRAWVLDLDRVEVYDTHTRQLIRRIALPAWSVAEFACAPDIAFDRSGTAFISHNGEPKLWQIDPDTFALTEWRVRLVGREHLDTGFGSLALAPDGRLFAVSASGGSLWRIDVRDATAQEITLGGGVLDQCI